MKLSEIIKKWLLENVAALISIIFTIVVLVVIDLHFKEFFTENPSLHAVMCSVIATGLVGFTTPNLKKTIDKKMLKDSIKKSLRPNVMELAKGIVAIETYLLDAKIITKKKRVHSYVENTKKCSETLEKFVQ